MSLIFTVSDCGAKKLPRTFVRFLFEHPLASASHHITFTMKKDLKKSIEGIDSLHTEYMCAFLSAHARFQINSNFLFIQDSFDLKTT